MATAGPTLRCAARCASSPLALGAAGDNGIGRSGQAASAVAVPLAALLSPPFKLKEAL